MKKATKATNKKVQVDMSPEGIDRRMRDLAQLYRLGVEIAKARPLGKLRHVRAGEEPH
jgi:hypothetical protein